MSSFTPEFQTNPGSGFEGSLGAFASFNFALRINLDCDAVRSLYTLVTADIYLLSLQLLASG